MNYLIKGGPVMIPLFLVSLLALTLIIERFIYFKKMMILMKMISK